MSHLLLDPFEFDNLPIHTASQAKQIQWNARGNCHSRGKSVMRPGFYVSQFAACETTQMQYTSWLCMMRWKPCMWKQFAWNAKCDMKTLLSFHFVSLQPKCTPSQLSPQGSETQFFKFFTHSFAADVESLLGDWQEVLNELHFRARVFPFHPLHDATAPPMHWDYLGALTCGNKCSLW